MEMGDFGYRNVEGLSSWQIYPPTLNYNSSGERGAKRGGELR